MIGWLLGAGRGWIALQRRRSSIRVGGSGIALTRAGKTGGGYAGERDKPWEARRGEARVILSVSVVVAAEVE
jgi:hypothetical protein